MIYKALLFAALCAASAYARDDAQRNNKETVNKNVVIVRSNSDDSSLRLQMVRSSDSKLFIKYRYSDEVDDDESDENDGEARLQYSLRLDRLIEYEEDGDNDGYQPDEDTLVQTVSFKGTDFSDWVASDAGENTRAYFTQNNVFGLKAYVGDRVYKAENDETIYPDEVKFDVLINSFPWMSTKESHVAVVAMVQSSMSIDREDGQNRVSLDGSDAYITWDTDCVFDGNNDNCTIVLSAIYDENTREDEDGSSDDNVKALIFSFVDEGSHPASLVWDPVMGSDPSSAVTGTASVATVALAFFAAVAVAAM